MVYWNIWHSSYFQWNLLNLIAEANCYPVIICGWDFISVDIAKCLNLHFLQAWHSSRLFIALSLESNVGLASWMCIYKYLVDVWISWCCGWDVHGCEKKEKFLLICFFVKMCSTFDCKDPIALLLLELAFEFPVEANGSKMWVEWCSMAQLEYDWTGLYPESTTWFDTHGFGYSVTGYKWMICIYWSSFCWLFWNITESFSKQLILYGSCKADCPLNILWMG